MKKKNPMQNPLVRATYDNLEMQRKANKLKKSVDEMNKILKSFNKNTK